MNPPRAEILSQGDEVVTGQIADTNAAWLSDRLTAMGVRVVRHTAVGDRLPDIVDAIRAAAERADLVVGTGGLGPTDDDLTGEAASRAFDRPLVLDPEALRAIARFFEALGRPMADTNRKQALLPEGALRLDNDAGTAPGFAIDTGSSWLAFMPGVPREMKRMFERGVEPLIRARFALAPAQLVTIRCAGIGESALQERVGSLAHPRIAIGTRTMLPENHLKLRAGAHVGADELRQVAMDFAHRIGAPVFAIEGLGAAGGSLAEVAVRALLERGERVAVSECASAGLLAAQLVRAERVALARGAEGADGAAFAGGDLAFTPADSELAKTAARAIAERMHVAWGAVTTRVSGDAKPLCIVAIVGPSFAESRSVALLGDDERRQMLAAGAALDLLRRAAGVFPAGKP